MAFMRPLMRLRSTRSFRTHRGRMPSNTSCRTNPYPVDILSDLAHRVFTRVEEHRFLKRMMEGYSEAKSMHCTGLVWNPGFPSSTYPPLNAGWRFLAFFLFFPLARSNSSSLAGGTYPMRRICFLVTERQCLALASARTNLSGAFILGGARFFFAAAARWTWVGGQYRTTG